jgi:hypothetical protein
VGRESLIARWLIGVLVYFTAFVIVLDVFLSGADFSLILQGAVLFSLLVSTVCVLLMWKHKTRSLPYYDAIFAAGIAGLLLIGAMPSDGGSSGSWSVASLMLLALSVLAGVAGRWGYAALMGLVRGAIRRLSPQNGGA